MRSKNMQIEGENRVLIEETNKLVIGINQNEDKIRVMPKINPLEKD